MNKTFCNPLNLAYRYQHLRMFGKWSFFREGADPTLIFLKDKYYLFVSMAAGFWYSDDLIDWRFHENKDLLIHDYAPDARQIGEYLYFCASKPGKNGPILRTLDPLSDKLLGGEFHNGDSIRVELGEDGEIVLNVRVPPPLAASV